MRRRAARIALGAGLLALVGVAAWGASASWALERELIWTRGTGWAAAVALLIALSASPLSAIAHRLRGRRLPTAAGITAAALATAHASVALATTLRGAWAHLLDLAWLRAGVLALAILLPLWLTSYPRVVRALRVAHWKPLHRLAYAAGLLAFQHALLAPLAPRAWVLGVFGVALALSLARLLPAQRSSSPRGPTTFSIEPSAPQARARRSSSPRSSADQRTTRVPASSGSARMSSTSEGPSSPGMVTSRRSRSGRSMARSCKTPKPRPCTTTSARVPRSATSASRASAGSSSTTRIFGGPSCVAILQSWVELPGAANRRRGPRPTSRSPPRRSEGAAGPAC